MIYQQHITRMEHLARVPTLMNLTPDTVAALEGVPAAVKLLAMPSVQEVRTESSRSGRLDDEVTSIGSQDEYFSAAEVAGFKADSAPILVITPQYAIYGGLMYSDHYIDMWEDGSGNGRLYHDSRDDHSERVAYRVALGYTESGDKDCSLAVVGKHLGDIVWGAVRSDRKLVRALRKVIAQYGREGKTSPEKAIRYAAQYPDIAMDYLAGEMADVISFVRLDDHLQESLQPIAALFSQNQEAAWDQANEAGELRDVGVVEVRTDNGDAVWVPSDDTAMDFQEDALSKLCGAKIRFTKDQTIPLPTCPDHPLVQRPWGATVTPRTRTVAGGYAYSLNGAAWSINFRTRRRALAELVSVLPHSVTKELARAVASQAKHYADAIVEEYDLRCRGEVYLMRIAVLDRASGESLDEHEVCEGEILGTECAERELEATMISVVRNLVAAKH